MKSLPILLLLVSVAVSAQQNLFSCRMGSTEDKQEIHLRGVISDDGDRGVIKMVITDRGQVYLKRYEVTGVLTSFEGGEVSDGPFTHMRLQLVGSSDVLYFNFLVDYPELGSSHLVMRDNSLYRGKCLSM